ncbi:MAG: ASCH domain-containing protein [Thermoplasmata archaeon]|nr:ASCH domain-containing protein [Euryarchaeota archaeon]RLF66157.1 MAG: ASCH domain-containing protein [Thermoplasmata archaeon]
MAKHLEFLGDYADKIVNGKKKVTIRRKTKRYSPGDIVYVHAGGKLLGKAIIKNVIHIKVKDLTDEIARMDGFHDKWSLLRALKSHFGEIRADDEVTVIEFELIERAPREIMSSELPYGGHDPIKIAELALKYLDEVLPEEDKRLLKEVYEAGSIRHVAMKMGGLKKRKIVRGVLRKAYKELVDRGIIKPKF